MNFWKKWWKKSELPVPGPDSGPPAQSPREWLWGVPESLEAAVAENLELGTEIDLIRNRRRELQVYITEQHRLRDRRG